MTVPAHGEPTTVEPQHVEPQHHPLAGAGLAPAGPAPASLPLDYTAGAGAGFQQVAGDQYDAAAAQASAAAAASARQQLAERPAHPDDPHAAAAGEAAADMRAEVAHEQAVPAVTAPERSPTPEGAFEVTLETRNGTDTIRILDPNDWPSSANSALHVGEYESWAEACLADGDYEQVWLRLDPRLGDINRMFVEWKRVSGRDQGKSRQSPASLRRAASR